MIQVSMLISTKLEHFSCLAILNLSKLQEDLSGNKVSISASTSVSIGEEVASHRDRKQGTFID